MGRKNSRRGIGFHRNSDGELVQNDDLVFIVLSWDTYEKMRDCAIEKQISEVEFISYAVGRYIEHYGGTEKIDEISFFGRPYIGYTIMNERLRKDIRELAEKADITISEFITHAIGRCIEQDL